jgi:hypothetical protein
MRLRVDGPLRIFTVARAVQVLPVGGGNGLLNALEAKALLAAPAGEAIKPAVNTAMTTLAMMILIVFMMNSPEGIAKRAFQLLRVAAAAMVTDEQPSSSRGNSFQALAMDAL